MRFNIEDVLGKLKSIKEGNRATAESSISSSEDILRNLIACLDDAYTEFQKILDTNTDVYRKLEIMYQDIRGKAFTYLTSFHLYGNTAPSVSDDYDCDKDITMAKNMCSSMSISDMDCMMRLVELLKQTDIAYRNISRREAYSRGEKLNFYNPTNE